MTARAAGMVVKGWAVRGGGLGWDGGDIVVVGVGVLEKYWGCCEDYSKVRMQVRHLNY